MVSSLTYVERIPWASSGIDSGVCLESMIKRSKTMPLLLVVVMERPSGWIQLRTTNTGTFGHYHAVGRCGMDIHRLRWKTPGCLTKTYSISCGLLLVSRLSSLYTRHLVPGAWYLGTTSACSTTGTMLISMSSQTCPLLPGNSSIEMIKVPVTLVAIYRYLPRYYVSVKILSDYLLVLVVSTTL